VQAVRRGWSVTGAPANADVDELEWLDGNALKQKARHVDGLLDALSY
jgi:hypothetical protein